MALFNSLPSPIVFLTIFLTPILVLVSLIVGLASVGASLGLRKMYVKALLKIFEVSSFFNFNFCYNKTRHTSVARSKWLLW